MSTTVITKPSINISPRLLEELKSQVHEAGQVILHVLFEVPESIYSSYIRIWPTTYLFDKSSPHRSDLVHAEGISYYPQWHECRAGREYYFSLIFSGLPKSCDTFDFIEECTNQAGAFAVHGIRRNQTDVYYLRMS